MINSADLLGYAVLTLSLQLNAQVAAADATCKDVNGLTHETGYHYTPGPDPCTLCICDNGNPTLCKAVFCKYKHQESLPNKVCKTFQFGTTCCELICLDDTISIKNDKGDANGTSLVDNSTNYDLGLRLVASCITALLSLGLLIFLVHRLRQRKIRVCVAGRQNNQIGEDQRSLSSMGYLDRNNVQHSIPLDDLPCNGNYPLWKPPSNYFPRGEAPPPYEEAVAAARAEESSLLSSPHTLTTLNFPSTYLSARNGHANASIVTNSQNGLPVSSPTLSQTNATSASPLITTNRPLSSPAAHDCYQLNQTESTASDFCAAACTTSYIMGSTAYNNLSTSVNSSVLSNSTSNITAQYSASSSNQLLLSNSPNSSGQNYQQHTALPRQGAAFIISATLPNSNAGNHRTIPKTLETSGSLKLHREYPVHQAVAPLFNVPLTLPINTVSDENTSARSTIQTIVNPSNLPSTISSTDCAIQTHSFYNSSSSHDTASASMENIELKSTNAASTLCNYKLPLAAANEVNDEGSFDSVTCTCSSQPLPPLHDDTDDYRSECENCKSTTGSKYYLDNEDELVTPLHETMTLQRRSEDTACNVSSQYYRTSLTLPTSTRHHSRKSSSRTNWFSSMPGSSTESSDGE